MSDKELALASIQSLPADAKLETIAERMEFLAAIRKGFDQIERGETVSHEEVKRQLASWLKHSEESLLKIWDNPDDDVFNELLSK